MTDLSNSHYLILMKTKVKFTVFQVEYFKDVLYDFN